MYTANALDFRTYPAFLKQCSPIFRGALPILQSIPEKSRDQAIERLIRPITRSIPANDHTEEVIDSMNGSAPLSRSKTSFTQYAFPSEDTSILETCILHSQFNVIHALVSESPSTKGLSKLLDAYVTLCKNKKLSIVLSSPQDHDEFASSNSLAPKSSIETSTIEQIMAKAEKIRDVYPQTHEKFLEVVTKQREQICSLNK